MEIPEELIDVTPMPSLPDPPSLSESRQVFWWRAYYDGSKYRIENGYGKVLAQCDDWPKLCAELGWYPGSQRPAATRATTHATSRRWNPAACDDRLDEILASSERLIGLHKPKRPLERRPDPPAEGQSVEILGYLITRRTLSGKPSPRTYYYAYDHAGEIVSFAENWIDWCHILNWFPRDDLGEGQSIPREAKPDSPPRPKPRTAPAVLNRHHYKSRDEIPEPWVYMGRGHVLGNPFVVVKDDPLIRSTLADDPDNPEHRSSVDAIARYKRWLWDKIRKRSPEVLRELGKITPETHLVCSCAPRPCHLDVVVRAWKWARGRTVLEGYAAVDETEPDWVGSESPGEHAEGEHAEGEIAEGEIAEGEIAQDSESPGRVADVEPAAAPASEGSPVAERAAVPPQNLELFGDLS